MKIELTSETLDPRLLKIVEDEMNAYIDATPEIQAAIEKACSDQCCYLTTGRYPENQP
jgi:hypothetical protein